MVNSSGVRADLHAVTGERDEFYAVGSNSTSLHNSDGLWQRQYPDKQRIDCSNCILTALTSLAIIFAIEASEVRAMPSISVRKIDEETLGRLRIQAAKHGHSMEEEVRQIIKRSVSTPEQLGDLAIKLFSAAYNGDELHIPERETHNPVRF